MKKLLKIKDAAAVHLRQGDLDGACTVYSLMMGLITAGKIKRKDICDLDIINQVDGREGFGRLIREFLYKVPKSTTEPETIFLRAGYTLEDIQNKLAHAYGSYVRTWYASCGRDENHKATLLKTKNEKDSAYLNKEDLIEFIAGEIDKNRPVEVAFRYRAGGGHAVLAIGYEKRDGEIAGLYCLDPAMEAPYDEPYNTMIWLRRNGRRIQYHMGMALPVLVDEALSIEK